MEEQPFQVKTPEYVSLQFQLANLGSRATASIIDHLIIIVAQVLTLIGFSFLAGLTAEAIPMSSGWIIAIILIIIFIFNFGYFIILEYFWGGRTIGKRILGIRVIQENGHNITFLSSIIRNFLRLIDSLPSSYALGILLIFLHSKHKRLGDLAAGTIVVHERGKQETSKLKRYIDSKGITEYTISIEEQELHVFSQKDWELLDKYCQRLPNLDTQTKNKLNKEIADILLPKINITYNGNEEMLLLALYLNLKKIWSY